MQWSPFGADGACVSDDEDDDCTEEEEEGGEMTETELIRMLDDEKPALDVCRTLLRAPAALAAAAAASAAWGGALQPRHAAQLAEHGFFVIDDFLAADAATNAAGAARARLATGALATSADHAGAPGAADAVADFRDHAARGDRLQLLGGWAAAVNDAALGAAARALKEVRDDLARVCHLAGGETDELQLAVYAGGGEAYQRHRDAIPDDVASSRAAQLGCAKQRRLTLVAYLGEGAPAGGALRLFSATGAVVDVDPRPRRLVCFFSGAPDHEVLPAHSFRAALTAWLY
ncbi:hypothetical protein M885DRAFT_545967 [Pelagophyceae sp. CCMP2097]|nr:hypothetical protein M885DRAFT_545967 [Pelagophyceae sp. CCMP2097]|mmetsp:Transcript_4191/g.14719  ORF Transcript_4191/g.14719 Transcript_4191/m.14719 type:complete len:289 (-) Transcript_4191:37-903(-)